MKTWRMALVALVLLVAIGGVWFWDGGSDAPASAQVNGTWQVETDIWKADLPAFLASLDASCDIDIEPQGVSAYVVAYRCPD